MASTKKGWSYSAGERGRNRVRAFEDSKSKNLTLELYQGPTGGSIRKRMSLGHQDRSRAKRQADEAAARLGVELPLTSSQLTLKKLFDNYLSEVTPQKSPRTQYQDRFQARLFMRCFGPDRNPMELSRREWDLYIRERQSGRLKPEKSRTTGVGPRTVEKDLRWLCAVFNWATQVGDGRGGYLLDRNPLKGLPFPKEKSPARPVITEDQYQDLLRTAVGFDWRFRVALVLAHETGHRIGAISKLRWSDIDLDSGIARWTKDNDKMGFEHSTPLSPRALKALEAARAHHPGIGDAWVFPAPGDSSLPCSRHLMRDWWKRAERVAGIPHAKGLGWHSLRRKFATDLQNAPLKVLCQLGGWKSFKTVLECYQHPDQSEMRRALEARDLVRAVG